MKKKVFVSHPFSSNPKANSRAVKKIEKEFLSRGVVPFSPLGAFRMYDEDADRELILELCEHMILGCDEVWIVSYGDEELSSGQLFEEDVAKINNIVIRYFRFNRRGLWLNKKNRT